MPCASSRDLDANTTVDTEEEFDWTKPIARDGHTLHSVARLARFQEFCEAKGVCPIYLVHYPIITSPTAVEILRNAVAAGKARSVSSCTLG